MGRMGFAASKDTRTTADTDQVIGKRTPGQPTFRHSSHTFQLRKITSEKRRDLHPLMYFQQHAVSESPDDLNHPDSNYLQNHAIARKAQAAGTTVPKEDLKANLKKRQVEIAKQSISKGEKRTIEQRQNGGRRTGAGLMSMASIGPLPTGSASSAGAGEGAKGFAQAEFDALQDNTLTQGPGDVGSTLGLDIQSADIGKSCRLSLSLIIQHADHQPQAISLLCSSGRLQGISRYLSTQEVLIHG
jgi:hypothetical protein